MGFDHSSNVVIRVRRGDGGQWDVSADGGRIPTTSFASREEACEYANTMTLGRKTASVVLLEDETSSQHVSQT